MNFSLITLGELLSSQNETIKRNAFSILKQLQKQRDTARHVCIACRLIKAKTPYTNCTDCDKEIDELEQ